MGFPPWLSGKESACNAGDVVSITESGRSLGRGHSDPLQNARLENPKDRGPGGLQCMGLQTVGHD